MITGNKTCMQCIHSLVCLTTWGPRQVRRDVGGLDADAVHFFRDTCGKNHVVFEYPTLGSTTVFPNKDYIPYTNEDHIIPNDCPRTDGVEVINCTAYEVIDESEEAS